MGRLMPRTVRLLIACVMLTLLHGAVASAAPALNASRPSVPLFNSRPANTTYLAAATEGAIAGQKRDGRDRSLTLRLRRAR